VDPALTFSWGTYVHVLYADSPAVDAVECLLPVDQRGVARPAGARCDLGAYELDPLAESPSGPSSTPLAVILGTPSATLASVPTLTPSETPSAATFTLDVNSFCRKGPGTAYEDLTDFLKGQSVQIEGRNQNPPRWWWVLIPDSNDHCWVSDSTGLASGILDGLTIIPAPPLPTLTPSPTYEEPTPTACATTANDPKKCD
jgi:hypothetical protein